MCEALIRIGGRAELLRIRINGRHPTFRIASDRIAQRALAPLNPLHEDLLDIACTVFAADSSVTRGGAARGGMGAGWKRQFGFTIPVRQPEVWRRAEVIEALTDIVTFLTGDAVEFNFIERPASAGRQEFLDLDPAGATFFAEDVILFSGGLDSFAGALERLSTSDGKIILLSHRSAPKVIPRQVRLADYLAARFPGRVLQLGISATRAGSEGVEPTQRSRSFLFAALAQAVAVCFGARQISFYENGIVSHNLPISPQVVGTMATRTTHPETLVKLNALMRCLQPDPIRIGNAYQWLTKTEVVTRIAQYGGTEKIGQAVSCTSVRDQDALRTHCGRCSQCLDRRFAILAAGLENHDPSEAYATDVLIGERDTDQSRTMATEWVRHALRLQDLNDSAFLELFGTEMTRILKGHPEMSRRDALQLFCDLHRRHSTFVRQALERAIRENAPLMAAQQLSPTSLLRLHCGTASALPAPALEQFPSAEPLDLTDGLDPDVIPDPDAPLAAAFFREGQRPVVAVHGLGRVTGRGAEVAHLLKPYFDDDRRNGLQPDAHQFVTPRQIRFKGGDPTKDNVRTIVSRCRKTLSTLYQEMHGKPPASPPLIQSRQNKGYRLDPRLRIMGSAET